MSTQDSEPRLDPRFRDPVSLEVSTNGGAMWGWIAGLAILVLVVFVLVGGWNGTSKPSARTAPPIDLGTCELTGATDIHGARITLTCPSDKNFTFVKK